MRGNLLACSLAAVLAAAPGCYADAEVAPGYAYPAEPDLEYIGDGIQVVDDLDYPVFYTAGFYWLWDGGYWYRSHTWRGGWGYVGPRFVPGGLRDIRSPLAYSHWRGGYSRGYAVRGRPGRMNRGYGRGPSVQPRVIAHGYGGRSMGGGHGGGRHR